MLNEEKILNSLNKLIEVLQKSSNTSQGHTRTGRGGDSNGQNAGQTSEAASRYSRGELEKTTAKLERQIKAAGDYAQAFGDSLKRVTNWNYVFGESVKDTADRIVETHNRLTDSTAAITVETIAHARNLGINSKEMKENTARILEYGDNVNKLNKLLEDEERLGKLNIELAKEEAYARKLTKPKQKEEREAVLARIEVLKKEKAQNLADAQTMVDVVAAFKRLKNIGNDTTGVFKQLSAEAQAAIRDNDIEKLKQKHIIDEINEAQKDYTDTMVEATRIETERQKQVKVQQDKINKAAIETAKKVGGSIAQSIDMFRLQLKNNVKESHFTQAGKMGMSDGDLSKFLGSNADILRGTTDTSDIASLVESGEMSRLHEQTTKTFGMGGAEGAAAIGTMIETLQKAGISTRDEKTLRGHISNVGAMSERVGMPKEEMLKFMKDLGDSGGLANMTEKYKDLSPERQQKAMNAEIEARIKNSKMLGYSTDQIKEQINEQKKNQFGGIGDKVKKMIGAQMFQESLADQGINMTDEEQKAVNAFQLTGAGTQEQMAIVNRLGDRKMEGDFQRRTAADAKAARTGDNSDVLDEAANRQVQQSLFTMFSSDEEAGNFIERRSGSNSRFGKDGRAKYDADGTLSKQLTGNATDPKDFNSSLLPMDQSMNVLKNYWDGVMANPMQSAAASLLKLVGQVGILVLQSGWGKAVLGATASGAVKAGNVMGGGVVAGGLGAGVDRALVRAEARTGAGFIANTKLGLAGKLAKGSGFLSAGLSAYSAYGDSKEKGESTGNAVASATGAGVGGGLGAWGGGAAGAAIGTMIFPGIGTVVGGLIGAGIGAASGAWAGGKTADGAWDTVTGEDDGPQARLAEAQEKRDKAQAELAKLDPEFLSLHPEVEAAILANANSSATTADLTAAALKAKQQETDYFKSQDDINAQLNALQSNQQATSDRYR